MIPEIEILEQTLDEGWALSQGVEFLEGLGRDPWIVLRRLWQDGKLAILRRDCTALADWEVERIFTDKTAASPVLIRCTDKGAKDI